jgi:hypothetical protein
VIISINSGNWEVNGSLDIDTCIIWKSGTKKGEQKGKDVVKVEKVWGL